MQILLTPEQTAERLGVTVGTLANWRTAGDGPPYVKMGSKLVRYPEDDLRSWLTENTVRTQKTA